ncbi:MAG: biotin/lipoate A/B protein ligase family protein [Desulfobacteraceae bacterium]
MKTVWRLLDQGPGPPTYNMAVDEALLASHVDKRGPATLRFYQWSTPTLSLGAGQKWPVQPQEQVARDLGLAVVRRPSGGRAVLHGGDLTYSVVAGVWEGFPVSTTAVYRRLAEALRTGLQRLGLAVESGTGFRFATSFACFTWAAPADLTWRGKKFMGSAQVWRGQSFLQHGTIILEPQDEVWRRLLGQGETGSPRPWPMISLAEILADPLALAALKTALLQGFEEVLKVAFKSGELSEQENIRVEAGCLPIPGSSSRSFHHKLKF